ncbi:MAG: hypothetical protein JWM16_687, partial [Verrucomicrobiales bacterium]|nr:hypothetical protein [Verrucomicrobiales bacterium]
MNSFKILAVIVCLNVLPLLSGAEKELRDFSINGGVQDGKARLVIEAQVQGLGEDKAKLLYATALEQAIQVSREQISHTVRANFEILQGEPKEILLTLQGEGEIKKVEGSNLQDWSVRQETNGVRTLVLRPRKVEKLPGSFSVTISAERSLKLWANPVPMLTFAPPTPALFSGYVRIEAVPELSVQSTNLAGLIPMEPKYLPEGLQSRTNAEDQGVLAFRFHGAAYTLPVNVTVADPEARRVVLQDFRLEGQLADRGAEFVLTAVARVKNSNGGRLQLLSGGVALADVQRSPDWHLSFTNGAFVLIFDKPGEFPLRLKFNGAVRQAGGWNNLDFRVAPGAVQPVTFKGLAADTQIEYPGAARPERSGENFVSFLPPDGTVKVSWKRAKPEAEGKLFYSAEMLSQVSISPGLMRQTALIEGKVMQGELSRVALLVRGAGNVTAVLGTNVLAWNIETIPNIDDRRLVVRFNQPQKDAFAIQLQLQTELGAFPRAVDVMQLRLEGATRFAGYLRLLNAGAVRLEVVQANGLSQISPEQFPESDTTRAAFTNQASQRFAFRFSSADFGLRVQADNVLPELSVSELMDYHLGETELVIDAEFELDIREAPLREVSLRIPKGYSLARLSAAGLSDYFQKDVPEQPDAELRLVYGQPISGRQVVQLRLERNAALGQATWTLPRIEVLKAKSTRGHISVSTDAGFRLTPERTQGLTDIATAFFPRKVAGIQAAFRLSDSAWEAAMRVERLPQTIQADGLHIFSVGEGIAYGSSTINYQISGAPVSAFRIALSDEYFNVEFAGKDVRNWQKTAEGYLVQLHTAVSGAYTLLVTCERPFKAQGDTLT